MSIQVKCFECCGRGWVRVVEGREVDEGMCPRCGGYGTELRPAEAPK